MPFSPFRSPRRRAGFTLVELMVALVISGLLMAVVFQMLSGQSRLVAVQSGKEEAQQNVRGALEIISSELRGAMPGAILDARDQSFTFMQPRAWGVVCSVVGTTVTALFPDAAALDAWSTAEASGLLVNTGTLAAPVWSPDPQSATPRARITAAQVLANGPNVGACAGMQAQGSAIAVQLTTDRVVVGLAGSTLMTYSLTQYDLAQVSGRWWLRRSSGVTNGVYNQQPLAGPVEQARFRFTYFTAGNPPVQVAAPGNNAAQLRALRMVQVRVASNSTQRINNRYQSDEGTITVTLRN